METNVSDALSIVAGPVRERELLTTDEQTVEAITAAAAFPTNVL